MSLDISTPQGYSRLLEEVMKAQPAKVRGSEYRAIVPDTFYAEHQQPGFFNKFNRFNEYLAKARVEYIVSKLDRDELVEAFTSWCEDKFSRQCVFYKPDWWWDGIQGHVNCVIAYQPMVMKSKLDLHVFMRSSDLWNAFPFDWYAQNAHLELFTGMHNLSGKVQKPMLCLPEIMEAVNNPDGVKPGRIYWHTSNLHVRQDDVLAIKEFLAQTRF